MFYQPPIRNLRSFKLIKKSRMVNQLREMLSEFEWSYFATFTSEEVLNERKIQFLMDRFNISIRKFEANLFWVAEPNSDRKGFHIHALIKVNKFHPIICRNGRLEIERIWLNNLINYVGPQRSRCMIKDYDSNLGGIIYVTKLIGKDPRVIFGITLG